MCLLVYLTLPKYIDAADFCERLLREKLAAGMNILGPCHSVFHWQGEIRKEEEWIILAQVARETMDKFQREVIKIHPYQTPCVIAWPIEQGHAPFLEWIKEMSGEA